MAPLVSSISLTTSAMVSVTTKNLVVIPSISLVVRLVWLLGDLLQVKEKVLLTSELTWVSDEVGRSHQTSPS